MRLRLLLTDWVLLQVEPDVRVTPGGIILPDTSANPVREGVVLLAGPGRRFSDKYLPIDVAPGQRVAFFMASADLKTGKSVRAYLDDNQVLVREQDILYEIYPG